MGAPLGVAAAAAAAKLIGKPAWKIAEKLARKYMKAKTKKDKTLAEEERIYYPIKYKCQFSWYCDGASDEPKNEEKYAEAYLLSLNIIDKKFHLIDITDGALFYHADYVRPAWARTKHRTTEIGDHIFYTWD